jgi:hypothetical protein
VPALSHGALTVDLPDDWGDRTTLMFTAPEGADRGVVSLNVQRVEADTAQGVLLRQLEELKQVDEGFKVLSQGELKCGLGAGAFTEVTLSLAGVPVRQILGVVVRDGLAFRITASAQAQHFDAVSARLWEILRSVRVGSENA